MCSGAPSSSMRMGGRMYRSIDPYAYLQPWWPRERFNELAAKHELPAAKIWLMYSIAHEDRTSDVPYPYDARQRKFDLSRWSDTFTNRFRQMISDLCGMGTRVLLVYVDGATWTPREWPYHRWNSRNNSQRLLTEDFRKAREAGPSGERNDDAYMRAVWYPLVDNVIANIQPKYRSMVVHIPTSEPRQTLHPTRHMVEYLRHRGVPRLQIWLSGNFTEEWRTLPDTDPLKRDVGCVSVHGIRDVKQADAALGNLIKSYPGVQFRPDSDGARDPKDGKKLSGKGLYGEMTGMTPAWWRGVLAQYPTAGMLLGMWKPQSNARFKELFQAAEPLFEVMADD